MTIAQVNIQVTVGAVSHSATDWRAINWRKVHRNVRRLQARIVKATQEGRWGKVKALQHLLSRSFSGKALAVKRATENRGKRTPGVDGEIWDTPQKKVIAIQKLRQRGYKPQPLRRIYIPKNHRKDAKRPLSIPTMFDRSMQALYLLALAPVVETTGDPNSYGFRLERAPADAIEQCFNLLALKRSAQWILEGDIRACFDMISHDWLLANTPMEKPILSKWLKAGYVEQGVLHHSEYGVPQGGIISPAVANRSLDGLEELLTKTFPKRSNGRSKLVKLVRFADDFVITGRSKEILEKEVLPLVQAFLKEPGLELSLEKTKITHIEDGFDFLGQNIRKYNGKLLIKPSQRSVQTLLQKVRHIIKANRQTTPGNLILQLNPIIRGWTNYHRHAVSKAVFNSVDNAIFLALWQWTQRRHPRKSRRWIKDKYFHTVAKRNWVFAGQKDGKEIHLLSTSSVPIQRHIKIKSLANPFDPAWEPYFEKRVDQQMQTSLKGRRQLLYLWKTQNGVCPICRQKITQATGWHNHHIVWRTKGGQDKAGNRILLHPVCHQQVHNQYISIEKPRLHQGAREA